MTAGLLVGAAAVYYFLMPSKIVIGTISGLAMVLNSLIPAIKVSQFVLMLNVVLVIAAVFIVGKEFGVKSIVASIFLGPAIDLCEWIYPYSKFLEPFFDFC